MKAPKSELAKSLLSNEKSASALRLAVERAVSARSQQGAPQAEYRGKNGDLRRVSAKILRSA